MKKNLLCDRVEVGVWASRMTAMTAAGPRIFLHIPSVMAACYKLLYVFTLPGLLQGPGKNSPLGIPSKRDAMQREKK